MGKTVEETAVIYCRTSTKGQRDEKTIEGQIAWAREAIKRDGVHVLPYGPKRDGWLKDDGVSGSLLDGRSFKQLIDDIEVGKVKPDFVYVYSLSRLAREDRSSKDKAKQIKSRIDAARIAGVLGAYGVMVRDESGTVDANSLGYDIKGAVSTEEYRNIRVRTIRGKARVLANNAMATGGRPPFGYARVPVSGGNKKNGTTYAAHPVEGPRFISLMSWFIEGGVTHAARKAMQAGWPSPRGSKATWFPSSIQQMLTNISTYLGEATRTIDGESFTLTYPPLIDLKTYAAIERRKKERTLKQRTTLLSTGYADCACGGHIRGHRSGVTTRFRLICGQRMADGNQRDSCGSVSEEAFTERLWEMVVARLVQIREAERVSSVGADPYGAQLAAAKAKLTVVQEQIDRIVGLYADDAIDRSALTKNNERLRGEKTAIQAEVDRLDRQREAHAQRKIGEESVHARVQAVLRRVRKGLTLDAKRQVLRDLLQGERVIVSWVRTKIPYVTLTLPAFGSLPAATVRADRDVWIQMGGVSKEGLDHIYDVDAVETVGIG